VVNWKGLFVRVFNDYVSAAYTICRRVRWKDYHGTRAGKDLEGDGCVLFPRC
jgi:hypothetical protein